MRKALIAIILLSITSYGVYGYFIKPRQLKNILHGLIFIKSSESELLKETVDILGSDKNIRDLRNDLEKIGYKYTVIAELDELPIIEKQQKIPGFLYRSRIYLYTLNWGKHLALLNVYHDIDPDEITKKFDTIIEHSFSVHLF